MKKIHEFTSQHGEEVELFLTKFATPPHPLAIVGTCDGGMPWARLTVNVDGLLPLEVAIDTNNEPPGSDYVQLLLDTGLFVETDKHVTSGFCQYPVLLYIKDFKLTLAEELDE